MLSVRFLRCNRNSVNATRMGAQPKCVTENDDQLLSAIANPQGLNVYSVHSRESTNCVAPDAHRWGLVNRLTPPGGALAEAETLARQIAANAPIAIRVTKRIVNESAEWTMAEAWSRQRELVDQVLASDDAREGAVAFAEKRPPKWTGR